jgi:hypothetical protein
MEVENAREAARSEDAFCLKHLTIRLPSSRTEDDGLPGHRVLNLLAHLSHECLLLFYALSNTRERKSQNDPALP